ncbi:MAG: FlgD immunoglobulin-like domain containing protein [Candidatus Eisenbacteria bacterium]
MAYVDRRPARIVGACAALVTAASLSISASAFAAPPEGSTWSYYRPGNTGVMGDYSDALWISPNGDPWIGGYDPFWEEGGLSRYIVSEDRWENFSNVDYPIVGNSNIVGASRVSDIAPDASGALWMSMWYGALYFDPAVGPDSFLRFTPGNSPIPPGRITDVAVADDGSVWFSAITVSWGIGGLARYEPGTGTWTVWDHQTNANGWPAWSSINRICTQPKPGGGYRVFVDGDFGLRMFDSATQTFTSVPGNVLAIAGQSACDDAGNAWFIRDAGSGLPYSIDYQRPDGTWVTPTEPYIGAGNDMWAFRALGNGQALMVDGNNATFRFDGTAWTSLGIWRPGAFTYEVDMDEVGNVWVSGKEGAAMWDAETNQWQRYRISNTGQMDNWSQDISLTPDGQVWITSNAAPGIGGISRFDGERWHNHNEYHYGLGEDWPFPTDNADCITFRPSTGSVAFNPMFNGLAEWNGSGYQILEAGTTSEGLVEDSDGRLWIQGQYFKLRYFDEVGFHDVPILGWGNNVVQDPDRPGTVWACASGEVVRTDGSYRYSRANTELPEINPMHDVFTGVAAGSNGVAWLGTTEGLFRLDAENGTHEWWHSSNSDMPGDQVLPLVVSPDGRVWFTNFGTNGIEPSLVWFDGTEFGTVTLADGLPHAQIWDAELRVVPDGYEVWMACASRGIAVLHVPMADPAGVGDIGPTPLAQLLPNSPNPFDASTLVRFTLAQPTPVRLDIFDAQGRKVRNLVDRSMGAGLHALEWDGRDSGGQPVASGVYFSRLDTGSQGEQQRRLTIIR